MSVYGELEELNNGRSEYIESKNTTYTELIFGNNIPEFTGLINIKIDNNKIVSVPTVNSIFSNTNTKESIVNFKINETKECSERCTTYLDLDSISCDKNDSYLSLKSNGTSNLWIKFENGDVVTRGSIKAMGDIICSQNIHGTSDIAINSINDSLGNNIVATYAPINNPVFTNLVTIDKLNCNTETINNGLIINGTVEYTNAITNYSGNKGLIVKNNAVFEKDITILGNIILGGTASDDTEIQFISPVDSLKVNNFFTVDCIANFKNDINVENSENPNITLTATNIKVKENLESNNSLLKSVTIQNKCVIPDVPLLDEIYSETSRNDEAMNIGTFKKFLYEKEKDIKAWSNNNFRTITVCKKTIKELKEMLDTSNYATKEDKEDLENSIVSLENNLKATVSNMDSIVEDVERWVVNQKYLTSDETNIEIQSIQSIDILNSGTYSKTLPEFNLIEDSSLVNAKWIKDYIYTTLKDEIEKTKKYYGVPTGVLLWFCGEGCPDGWLECYGQEVSRTTYKNLFDVIGVTYGEGNSTTTFNLPNLEDRFIQSTYSQIGQTVDAGLPNIWTGQDRVWNIGSVYTYSSGMREAYPYTDTETIEVEQIKNTDEIPENRRLLYSVNVSMDASKCNEVYGNSHTVQPKSIKLKAIIKY